MSTSRNGIFLFILFSFVILKSLKGDEGNLYGIGVPDLQPFRADLVNNPFPCGQCAGATGANYGNLMGRSLSPGAGGAPSPCCQSDFIPTPGNTILPRRVFDPIKNETVELCENQLLSPLIWEPCIQYQMEFLRRHRWEIYCPRYDWFYDPAYAVGETPCQVLKLANSGVDVTLLSPDSPVPICTTTPFYHDLLQFNVINANSCGGIREENFEVTQRRLAYGLNIVNSCGKLRTVVLSKARDEFPPGFTCRLVSNPCRPYCNVGLQPRNVCKRERDTSYDKKLL